MKYVVSWVDTSKAFRLLVFCSADLTVMQELRSILPWGVSYSDCVHSFVRGCFVGGFHETRNRRKRKRQERRHLTICVGCARDESIKAAEQQPRRRRRGLKHQLGYGTNAELLGRGQTRSRYDQHQQGHLSISYATVIHPLGRY